MRVAVVGVNGRLGHALLEALGDAPFIGTRGPIGWDQPELDLDTLTEATAGAFLDAERPEVVIHAAAWTDVDGCARDPELALRRNGTAVGELANACARRGTDLVFISTNEVFDGRRTDGIGYAPGDERNPINPYGAAKAEGERLAFAAFGAGGARGRLGIVRTSWLHGPPGGDFPAKIAAAALRAKAAGEPLRVVGDEIGCPTYTPTSPRRSWSSSPATRSRRRRPAGRSTTSSTSAEPPAPNRAREVLRATGIGVEVVDVPGSTWTRASTPPSWAVLAPTPPPVRPADAWLAGCLRRCRARAGALAPRSLIARDAPRGGDLPRAAVTAPGGGDCPGRGRPHRTHPDPP